MHYLANGGADHVQRFRSFSNAVAKGETAEAALAANYEPPSALEPRYRDSVQRWPKRGGAPWASLEQLRCYRRRHSGEAVSCPL